MKMTNLFLASGVSSAFADGMFMFAFVGLSIVVVIASVFFITKYIHRPAYAKTFEVRLREYEKDTSEHKPPKPIAFNFTGVLLALLAIGFLFRILFVFIIKGYRIEYNTITAMMETISSNGLNAYYVGSDINLYPLVVYLYSFLGIFTNLFGLDATSWAMPIFIKIPLIIADIFTAWLLYRTAKKYVNEYVGLIFAGFVMLFPAFIMASSVWGSVYSLFMLAIVSTFYFIVTKNYIGTIAAFSVSLFLIQDALFVIPVVATFLVFNIIKSIVYIRSSNKTFGLTDIFKDKEARNALTIPLYILASLVVMYSICVPLIYKGYSSNPFKWFYMFMLKPLSITQLFGHNSLNIFNLFLRNGLEFGGGAYTIMFSILFLIIITAITILVYLSRKNRANLSFLGAYVMFTLTIYFVGYSEMSLLPVIALSLFSVILIRDKRIFNVISMISILFIVNSTLVMMNAGYLNNIEDYYLNLTTAKNVFYTGNILLDSGTGLIISILCSVGTILVHLYATMVLLDVAMSNKRKLFADLEHVTLFNSVANFYKP